MLSYRETSISVLSCCLWWCGLNKPRLITFCCWRVFAFIFFTVLFSANVSVVIAGCISNCVMCIVKVTDVFFGNVSLDFMCWSVATYVIVHRGHSGVFMSYISLHMQRSCVFMCYISLHMLLRVPCACEFLEIKFSRAWFICYPTSLYKCRFESAGILFLPTRGSILCSCLLHKCA